MKGLVLPLLLLLASCATAPSAPVGAVAPSALLTSQDDYDGTTVTVRGWMNSEFENYSLWDSREAEREGSFMAACVGLLIPRAMDTARFHNRYVAIEGTFRKRPPENLIFLGGCNLPVLELDPNVTPVEITPPRLESSAAPAAVAAPNFAFQRNTPAGAGVSAELGC